MYHQEDSRWLNLIPLFMINNPQNPDYSRTRKWVEGEPLVAIRARSRKDHGALQKIWGSSILFSRMGIAIGAHSLNKPVCIWKPSFFRVYIYISIFVGRKGRRVENTWPKKIVSEWSLWCFWIMVIDIFIQNLIYIPPLL